MKSNMNYQPRLPDETVNYNQKHPLSEALHLAVGGFFILVVVMVTGYIFIDSLVPKIPPTWEAAAFGHFWEDGDPALSETEAEQLVYIQGLVDDLSHGLGSPLTFKARIIEDDMLNAFAMPGGAIILTTGLLDAVESENELAFVLGHELGHFLHRHHLRRMARQSLSMVVMGILGNGSMMVVEQSLAMLNQGTEATVGREEEREADAMGLLLVAERYGHIGGAEDFFLRLKDVEVEMGSEEIPHFLHTHPLSDERIARLQAQGDRNGWQKDTVRKPLPWSPLPSEGTALEEGLLGADSDRRNGLSDRALGAQ